MLLTSDYSGSVHYNLNNICTPGAFSANMTSSHNFITLDKAHNCDQVLTNCWIMHPLVMSSRGHMNEDVKATSCGCDAKAPHGVDDSDDRELRQISFEFRGQCAWTASCLKLQTPQMTEPCFCG